MCVCVCVCVCVCKNMLPITHMGQGNPKIKCEYQPQNCDCLNPEICLHSNILHGR